MLWETIVGNKKEGKKRGKQTSQFMASKRTKKFSLQFLKKTREKLLVSFSSAVPKSMILTMLKVKKVLLSAHLPLLLRRV